MQTDIMLSLGERTLIIDTKYYSHILQSHYNKQIFHSHNFTQIYTYVGNYDDTHKGNVDGMLLYAKTDEDISPNITKIIPEGNRILVRTLDLNQDFQGICVQLDKYINIRWFFRKKYSYKNDILRRKHQSSTSRNHWQ